MWVWVKMRVCVFISGPVQLSVNHSLVAVAKFIPRYILSSVLSSADFVFSPISPRSLCLSLYFPALFLSIHDICPYCKALPTISCSE